MKKVIIGGILFIGGIFLSLSPFLEHYLGLATAIIASVIGLMVLLTELYGAYKENDEIKKDENGNEEKTDE